MGPAIIYVRYLDIASAIILFIMAYATCIIDYAIYIILLWRTPLCII